MKKATLFLIAFAFFGMVKAQNTSFTFNHIALSVKDLDKSASFYKDVLQLQEITNKTKMEGIRWFSLGEGKELHLISLLKEPVTINKAVHFALTAPNLDAFVKKLNTMKIPYSDWPGTPNKINMRADGIQQIYLQDPDGYWIEVNSTEQSQIIKTKTIDLVQARKIIESKVKQFEVDVNNADSLAVANHYAKEGSFGSIKGKDKLISASGKMIKSMSSKNQKIRFTTYTISSDDEYLFETGLFEFVEKDNSVKSQGNYLLVWKQEEGEWKIYRDIGL